MSNGLRIANVAVRPPTPVTEEEAAHHVQERQHVDIDVENFGASPLHVWSGMRAFAFDSSTGELEIYLADPGAVVPPGIEIVSDYPRVPPQVVVAGGATTTIDVPVPTVMRRRVPGQGLGMSFVEEPIENIRQVHIHLQYADVPFQAIVGENPDERRRRLQSHGQVVEAVVTPTSSEE
jgi:hypothetical protein